MYEAFARLLKERGVSAYQVSKATGVSTAALSSWKNGQYTPKADKMMLLAEYFDVPLETFVSPKTA